MRILLALCLLISLIGLGCDDGADATADNRTAGEKVAAAGEKAGDALNTAAQKTGEVVGDVTDDTVDLARKTRDQGQQAADAAGVNATDAEAIHDVIAQLAEAAMSPGRFADIVERLAEGDRARIGEYANKKHPDLANIVGGKAAAAWKKGYGHAFDINDETATFGAGAAPITLAADGKTATVPFAGLSVPFVRESAGWRVDAPDVLTGEGLKNALIKRLDAIGNGITPLPKDEREGHRVIAQQVLEAIMTTSQPESPAVPLR